MIGLIQRYLWRRFGAYAVTAAMLDELDESNVALVAELQLLWDKNSK